jgi:uncharacterized protein (TIRG00374 family)
MPDFSDNIPLIHRLKVRKNYWGLAFRGIITGVIIAYLALKINWPELSGRLLKADSFWLIIACLLFGVVYVFAALRWWFLMQIQEIHLPLKVVVALTFIGQFFNSFLLGAVGGDIIKAAYLYQYAPNQKTHATLSIIVDRIFGLCLLIGASLLAMPWQFDYLMRNSQINPVMFGLLVAFSLSAVVGIGIVVIPFHRAPSDIRSLWNRIPYRYIVELMVSGIRQHGAALNLTLASLLAGIAMTAVLTAACYCIGIGIGLTATYMQMLVILTVVICVISLPISIGGHGVREGIFVVMFATFRVSSEDPQLGDGQETAILFSLLFFAVPLIWSLIGGIVYLSFHHDYERAVLRDH